jgi:probable HAF family extracellular repeat protein
MHDLGTLDGPSGGTSGADAINDLGQIVGSSDSMLGTRAAYFSRHGVIGLGTLGGLSDAHAVNNLGQVVGSSATSDGNHAFITDLQGGPMLDLNTLIPPNSGWVRLSTADGINDAGQIIGTGVLPGYENDHAYLLTPDDGLPAALVTVTHQPPGLPAIANHDPQPSSVDLGESAPVVESADSAPHAPGASCIGRSVGALAAAAAGKLQEWPDTLPNVVE